MDDTDGYPPTKNTKQWELYAKASLSANVLDDEGVMNYVAVILRLDNPRFDDIVAQFRETVRMFQEKPGQE